MFNNTNSVKRKPKISGLSFHICWVFIAALCIMPSICVAETASKPKLFSPDTSSLEVAASSETASVETNTIPAETKIITVISETNTIETKSIKTSFIETSSVETETQTATGTLSSSEVIQVTAAQPVIVTPSLPLSYVKAGLALMPTSYVRVSEKHPGESGFNSDFMFGCYIGEIYDYVDKKHNLFERWYMFLFGLDNKWSFTPGQFFGYVGTLYGLEDQMKHISGLFDLADPGSSKAEKNFFPTIAVGMRDWIFTSMGTSFELTELFSNTQWIRDYYIVLSKKIGNYGLYTGYLYGDFVPQLKANMGALNSKLSWTGEGESHTYFIGFDMPSFIDSKKRMAFEFVYVNPESFLINTTFPGIWGFDLALLKVPKGVAILAYWSFRSNLFTANGAEDALKF